MREQHAQRPSREPRNRKNMSLGKTWKSHVLKGKVWQGDTLFVGMYAQGPAACKADENFGLESQKQ